MPGDGARWGFHRLCPQEATRLVADAGVRRGDLVLDLGAGDGAITAPLVRAGARVIAIELHPGRARALRERFAHDDVKVVCADVADLWLPRRPFRVVANPPFAATTAILKRLVSRGSALQSAQLIVPAHVAMRWTSGRGAGNARWAAMFDIELRRRMPRGAFRPPPPSPAAVLAIRRRGSVDAHEAERVGGRLRIRR